MAQQTHPNNVVGRDGLIARIWHKLESRSLRFTAERRIGKTTVMKKMCAEPTSGHTPVFIDLEGIRSPEGFVEKLLNSMRDLRSMRDKGGERFAKYWKKLDGAEIGGFIKLPKIKEVGWAVILDKLIEGLYENEREARIVLFLDEIPYMLQSIALQPDGGVEDALNILDRLRAARQKHDDLRMVFAGSVGLHHVLHTLRGTTRASQPVNDMELVEIQPLELADAVTLAQQQMQNEELVLDTGADISEFARQLAEATDCVPFYLGLVVSRLAEQDSPVTLEDAARVVREHLTDDQDRWEMEHFRARLRIYYPGSHVGSDGKNIPNRDLASTVLDALALAGEPQSIEAVWRHLKAKHSLSDADRHHIVEMLSSLAKDHYLITTARTDLTDLTKFYAFRFPLIRKWWVTAQGLKP